MKKDPQPIEKTSNSLANESLLVPAEPPAAQLWRTRNKALADGDLDLCADAHVATCDRCTRPDVVCRVLRYGAPVPGTISRKGLRLCAPCFRAYLDERAM